MRHLRLAFALCLLAPTAALAAPSIDAGARVISDVALSPKGARPRLDWSLDLLAEKTMAVGKAANVEAAVAAALAEPRLASMVATGLLHTRGGDVHVWAWASGDMAPAERALRDAGGRVERQDAAHGLLQAWVPASALAALADSGAFRFVSPPAYAYLHAGSKTTEGDVLLEAAALRAARGVNGTGVRVGVTSDTVRGLGTAVASGDLPPNVNISGCNMGGDPQLLPNGEGTAMLEIVHDLAPGAELWFGYWLGLGVGSALDFNQAIDCLAANTDVVVDDIGFINAGPYDGTSVVSQNTSDELNRASNRIRLYATSVGNAARGHYEEAFNDSGYDAHSGNYDWDMHQYVATSKTTDAGVGFLCNPGSFCGDTLRLAQNGQVRIFLQWNDPFSGSSNDYDMWLVEHTGVPGAPGIQRATSQNIQDGSQPPTEAMSYVNPNSGVADLEIRIGRFSGDARNLEMFVLCSGCQLLANGAHHNFNTTSGSVLNQSDAGGGVFSVGAIAASDPNTDDIETFSSRGPTNDGRMKPDVTAIDGVQVTGAAGFPNPFFGTSAASPHIAGIAALLLQASPGLRAGEPGDNPAADRTTLRNAILTSAKDRGVAGADNTYGAGLADANAAAALLGPGAAPCVRDAATACLQGGRFEVKVNFDTGSASGQAQVMGFGGQRSENDESAFYTFFSVTNFEMGVKVLNACIPAFGNKYWVFVSGLTDQGWTVTVRDSLTGGTRTYSNAVGHLSTTFADTSAFGC